MKNTESNQLNPQVWNVAYRPFLMRIALGKVNSYQTAEDLVQETFLSAWRSRDQFRGDCTERTFLARILRNKIIDHYRHRARRPAIPVSQLEANDGEERDWMESRADENHGPDPSLAAEREDFRDHLDAAIERLPDRMKQVVRLWLLDEKSTEEVTRLLDISSNNLWVIMHRAKKALRNELEKEWSGVTLAGV